MDDDTPLPDMRTGVLDDDGLEALFRDISALAVVDEIIVKQGAGRVDDSKPVTMAEAKQMLTERRVRGVQLRYRHEGATWWDTLMCESQEGGGGVRLVRVRHDFGT